LSQTIPRSYPTPSELQTYLDVVDRLSTFETSQRLIRGYGAFTEADCIKVSPAVMKVTAWLKHIMENCEDE